MINQCSVTKLILCDKMEYLDPNFQPKRIFFNSDKGTCNIAFSV